MPSAHACFTTSRLSIGPSVSTDDNAKKAGVDGSTPHDLRHFAASVLIDQGANVKAVQKHLGHSSAVTTLNVYAHLWPESENITRRALDAGLAAVVSPTCHGEPVAERS